MEQLILSTKTLKRPYIEPVGYSSEQVTGSAYLVKYQNYNILMDYGLVQSQNIIQNYRMNKEMHKNLKPRELTCIILSHGGHIDHTGRLPMLYARGCTCPIYVSRGSKNIIKLMLEDSLKIFTSDCEKLNRKCAIKAMPLYTQDDINNTLKHIIECDYNKTVTVNKSISFTFYPAHHIIHASQILLSLKDNMCTKRIGFTGDIGSTSISRPYVLPFQDLPKCEVLLAECTYSAPHRNHKAKDRIKDIEKIKSVVCQAKESNSSVLIPVFSLDRLEVILTMLKEIFQNKSPLPIYIDSPLGMKIAKYWEDDLEVDDDLWQDVYQWGDVTWLSEHSESVVLSNSKKPCIILAGGGMMTGGKSVFWAKELLSNSHNFILFCGYSADDTLASKIKSGESKYLKIDGESVKNQAEIVTLNSFSSHASHDELIDYYTRLQYNKICLVHSDQDSKIEFSKELKEALSKANKTSKVICSNSGTKIYF